MLMKLRYLKGAVKILYKNLYFGRRKGMMLAIFLFGLVCSYIASPMLLIFGIGRITVFFFGLFVWYCGLPMFIILRDLKEDSNRMGKLIQTIPEFYDGIRIRN